MEIKGPSPEKVSNPLTNSAMIRKTLHGSDGSPSGCAVFKKSSTIFSLGLVFFKVPYVLCIKELIYMQIFGSWEASHQNCVLAMSKNKSTYLEELIKASIIGQANIKKMIQ